MIFNRNFNEETDSLASFSTTSFNRAVSSKSLCLIPEYTDRVDYVIGDIKNKLL